MRGEAPSGRSSEAGLGARLRRLPGAAGLRAHLRVCGPCGPFCAHSHGNWAEDKEPAGCARAERGGGGAGCGSDPRPADGLLAPAQERNLTRPASQGSFVKRAWGSAGAASGPRIPAAVSFIWLPVSAVGTPLAHSNARLSSLRPCSSRRSRGFAGVCLLRASGSSARCPLQLTSNGAADRTKNPPRGGGAAGPGPGLPSGPARGPSRLARAQFFLLL